MFPDPFMQDIVRDGKSTSRPQSRDYLRDDGGIEDLFQLCGEGISYNSSERSLSSVLLLHMRLTFLAGHTGLRLSDAISEYASQIPNSELPKRRNTTRSFRCHGCRLSSALLKFRTY